MFCSRKGNGIPITCTATSQKWTGRPTNLAGSKNPLTLGMGSVNGGKMLIDKLNQILNSEDESSVSYVISLFIKKKSERDSRTIYQLHCLLMSYI